MLTILTGDLEPTATYKRRQWCWVSNGSGFVDTPSGELIPAMGKLTIKLQKGERVGSKVETDTYAVQELPAEVVGTRLFGLLSLTDPTQPEIYKTTIGGRNLCRCMAGQCRVVSDAGHGCKHRDSVEAAEAAGAFDETDVETFDPADPWVITRTGPIEEPAPRCTLPALPAVFEGVSGSGAGVPF
jgi:hypothetical protein